MRGELTGTFNRDRLLQVLSNLLNNAIQHGSEDSPVSLFASGDAENLTTRQSLSSLVLLRE